MSNLATNQAELQDTKPGTRFCFRGLFCTLREAPRRAEIRPVRHEYGRAPPVRRRSGFLRLFVRRVAPSPGGSDPSKEREETAQNDRRGIDLNAAGGASSEHSFGRGGRKPAINPG